MLTWNTSSISAHKFGAFVYLKQVFTEWGIKFPAVSIVDHTCSVNGREPQEKPLNCHHADTLASETL